MHTLVLEPNGYSPYALELYRKLGPVWLGKPPAGKEAFVTLLIIRLAHRLDDTFLSNFPALVAIASPTTGLTHIDLDVCRKKAIRVFSLADCRETIDKVTSTSELTIGLIIALLRHIPQAHHDITVYGRWDRDRFRSRQLSNLTLGIIGLGRIGGHMAHYARSLGMRVLASDPYQPTSRFSDLGVEQIDLVSLLRESDIVTLHANLRGDNFNLIGAAEIAYMRSGALLINTARGALLDESAVASALGTGQLGGVAVDVLANEHSEASWADSLLVSAGRAGYNVILTPHIGGCTTDAMHITEDRLAEVIVRALEGEG